MKILNLRSHLGVESCLMVVTLLTMLTPITVALIFLTVLIRLQFSHLDRVTVHLVNFVENVCARLFLSECVRAPQRCLHFICMVLVQVCVFLA